MSKTFEPKTFDTAHHDNKILYVGVLSDNPRLLIKEFDGDNRGFAFKPSDAPALALAILEASGVEAKPSNDDPGTTGNLGRIAYQLMIHIEDAENIAAEAEAQAKLEAEALDCWKAFHNAEGSANFDDMQWSDLMPATQAKWLAVARRAREMRAEK